MQFNCFFLACPKSHLYDSGEAKAIRFEHDGMLAISLKTHEMSVNYGS